MQTFRLASNPFVDPAALTLQDVIDKLPSADTISPRQQREISSALNSTASWLQRPLSGVPANHDFLRRSFERLSPLALGVTKGRFNNVRSLLKQSLKVAGVPTSGRTYLAPLSLDWQKLHDAIDDTYGRRGLARLFRFASAKGIAPEEVSDGTVEAFRKALGEESLTARPDTAAQSAVRLWNRSVAEVQGWPRQRLTPLRQRNTYGLSWTELPRPFVVDAEKYLGILGGEDPTHPLAPPRPLKALSIRTRRYQILQFLSALHHQGEDIKEFACLADLCRLDRVKRALKFFIDRHRQRHGAHAPAATSMIGGIADAIRAIAKHHARVAPADLTEITRIAARLNHRPKGIAEKNRARLKQIDSPPARHKLLAYPQMEMHKLSVMQTPGREDAVRYSVLLAIEILIVAPMRASNLAGLDLDRHFTWPPARRGDIGISIQRSEVKNQCPLEYRIRAGSAAALWTYLDRFRPLLSNSETSALFPGLRGHHKRADSLSKQIKKLLCSDLGIVWHAHLFRHLAARINLEGNPGDYEGTRRLLGHRNIETTFQIYEGENMRPAVDRYDRLLEEVRGPTPTSAHARKRQARRPSANRDRHAIHT